MAVKNGGGPDTEANTLLRDVVKQAKSNSVPVENIQRAIKRASEGLVGDFVESTFEACELPIFLLSRLFSWTYGNLLTFLAKFLDCDGTNSPELALSRQMDLVERRL